MYVQFYEFLCLISYAYGTTKPKPNQTKRMRRVEWAATKDDLVSVITWRHARVTHKGGITNSNFFVVVILFIVNPGIFWEENLA